jgi:Tol biopolymer transport system component
MKRASLVGALAIALLILACSDNDPPTGPTTGSIAVTVSTTGNDAPTGYTVVVGGSTTRSVGVNGSVTFSSVSSGAHQVELTDVPDNCTVTTANPATVTVNAGGATPVAMNVVCSALVGTIAVTVSTTGEDIPGGYTLVLDGGTTQAADANGSVTFTSVAVGSHEVELTDLPANCSVSGANPVTIEVTFGALTPITMAVQCGALAGAINLVVTSTGDDIPPEYQLIVDGGTSLPVSANGSLTITGLTPGDHTVELTEVPENCSVSGENPVSVTVAANEMTQAAAVVDCHAVASSKIAFHSHGNGVPADVYTVNPDGSMKTNLTNDASWDYEPVWSPDASRIAYLSEGAIHVMDADGSGRFTVVDNVDAGGVSSGMPRWSPDGGRLAYWSGGDVFVVNTDGTGLTNISQTPIIAEHHPVWSHDGARIAFLRQGQIFVMDADGDNSVQVTAGPADKDHAWSPVDDRIVFRATDGELYSVLSNGEALTQLTITGVGNGSPTWSHDGTQIAFYRFTLETDEEIYVMDADGSSVRAVTNSPESSSTRPSWSPDDSRLVFWSNRDGNGEIYVVDVDGSNLLNLTASPQEEGLPSWSPTIVP